MRVINYCWFLKSRIDYNHYKCSTDFKKLNQPSCFSLIPRMTNIAVFKKYFLTIRKRIIMTHKNFLFVPKLMQCLKNFI